MKQDGWISTLGLLVCSCLSTLGPAQGGKVLVMPVDGSHWLSMKILVKELALQAHEMVVLVPESSMLINGSDYYRTQTFPVPYSSEELDRSMSSLKVDVFLQPVTMGDVLVNVERLISFTNLQAKGCEALLYNQPLMQRLRDEAFELLLTDPFLPCGSIIARSLSLPAVYFLRGLPCGLEDMAAQCPTPPSFVPRFFTGNTDHMNFPQRVKNMLMTIMGEFLCRKMYASFDELSSRYLGQDITYKELISHGAIWLLRYDFTFEYPRPIMPNMVHIGGINCAGKKALPTDLETFVEESGEDGFVVFTLGSIVSEMPKEMASRFSEAFRQIPQRVLWRHTGPLPDNLPENVRILNWLPQNDLLAHPKARAFITHGGTHGIYEAICNGVPMVMVPLFGDQSDNVERMVHRGVAVALDIYSITTAKLLETLNMIINEKSYKEKMTKLSAVHKDRPIEPLDLAVFWTEFVMRNKGADHLRVAAHELNWVQYHSLDVIGLLLLIIVTVVIVTVKCCTFCCRKCCSRKTLKKKKD
ncbi:UDP glucuronosyltransferase 1 family, polypeptide B1 isoform X2 [Conger conger]|uniref:UDP glucuronosyltransferase 1 family, polypeptide B1 isoform X2 n=1 Tax=Conger conger TaxID=82655 RepID=UPI002A5AB0FF|nr:UDP glucuronosyltransferase 1 family, polypeptide B1 isoform X2 [Conger conger]